MRVCREWLAKSSPQFGETTTSGPKQWVVVAHAKRCQNSADPIGQTDALGDEFGPFANTSSGILIGLIGNRLHRAHARLASQPSEKCPKQQLGINTVRLCAACPTIDRHAGRLDNVHFYSMAHKPARQPEARPPSLVDSDHALDTAAYGGGAGPISSNGRLQCLSFWVDRALRFRMRKARHLRRKHPTFIAHFNREDERRLIVHSGSRALRPRNCPRHLLDSRHPLSRKLMP